MTKHGTTKDIIVRLISSGTNNLSAISEKLGLAPSTVSKHIHDLEVSGVISQKVDDHTRKWKYYTVNTNTELVRPSAGTGNAGKDGFQIGRYKWAVSALVVLLAAGGIASYLFGQGSQNSVASYIPISLTDPPHVPLGTQSLFINYSALSVLESGANGQHWVEVNASGRIDLMTVINESEIIGELGIASNTSISAVSLNITSASIIINNTEYPVLLTNRQVTATVSGTSRLNASSGVLLDFSPTVVPAYAQNSTSYVMLPTLAATIDKNPLFGKGWPGNFAGATWGFAHGGTMPLGAGDKSFVFRSQSPNVSITNATLTANGNYTQFSIGLASHASGNVTVLSAVLCGGRTYGMFGGQPMAWNASNPQTQNDSSGAMNWQGTPGYAGAGNGPGPAYTHVQTPSNGIAAQPNGQYAGPANLPGPLAACINFIAGSNGTMTTQFMPPFPGPSMQAAGYTLQPGASTTLTYNGELRVIGREALTLPAGPYRIMVLTDRGIVQSNATMA